MHTNSLLKQGVLIIRSVLKESAPFFYDGIGEDEIQYLTQCQNSVTVDPDNL